MPVTSGKSTYPKSAVELQVQAAVGLLQTASKHVAKETLKLDPSTKPKEAESFPEAISSPHTQAKADAAAAIVPHKRADLLACGKLNSRISEYKKHQHS